MNTFQVLSFEKITREPSFLNFTLINVLIPKKEYYLLSEVRVERKFQIDPLLLRAAVGS